MITPFIRQETETKIALCRQGSCCLTLEKRGEDEFWMTDDYGGSVKLDKNDLSLFADAAKHFI